MNDRETGFSFVELVVVLVIVGTLAVFILPRFADRSAYDLAGYQQELAAGLRHAQKYAYVSGCPIRAAVAASGLEIRHSSSCNAGDFSELMQSSPAPAGVSLSPVTFEFLADGRASTTVTIALNSSAGAREVAVIGATGYVDVGG